MQEKICGRDLMLRLTCSRNRSLAVNNLVSLGKAEPL